MRGKVKTSTARTPRRGRLVSSAVGRRVAGAHGARVILLFPRPAHAPAPSWWRRVLSWLRYGTSAVAATQGSPRRPPCQAA